PLSTARRTRPAPGGSASARSRLPTVRCPASSGARGLHPRAARAPSAPAASRRASPGSAATPRARTRTGRSPSRPSPAPARPRAARCPPGSPVSARSGRGSRRRPARRTPTAGRTRCPQSHGTSPAAAAAGPGRRHRNSSDLLLERLERDLPILPAASHRRLLLVEDRAGAGVVAAGFVLPFQAGERPGAADQPPQAILRARLAADRVDIGPFGGREVVEVEVDVALHELRLAKHLRIRGAV